MRRLTAIGTMFGVFLIGLLMVLPTGQAADMTKAKAAEMVLAVAKAARTVYVTAMKDAKKGGVKPSEAWVKDDHGIMLPAQFVKEMGKEISGFELGLIGTDPLYESNAAKTPKEKEMLSKLTGMKPGSFVTGEDGGKTIGMSGDFAIVQSCADCHNKHKNTKKTDWKKDDFMGAIVVRMR